MRTVISVRGIPAPQGSKRYVGASGGKGRMVESSKAVGPWREAVRAEVQRAAENTIVGPVAVELIVWTPRPKGHYGAKGLLPSAPARPAGRPDLDKLARAILDGVVAGGAIGDDAQIVALFAAKVYANEENPPGARIVVEALR